MLWDWPPSSGMLARDCSVVNSRLSSRAALTGPGASPEAAAVSGEEEGWETWNSEPKEASGPREGLGGLNPPAIPGFWATLTEELPKAIKGMLAVREAADMEAEGTLDGGLE